MTTNYRTKPNPLLQYSPAIFPPSSLQPQQPAPPASHQRHHSNPQMQAASMGMYAGQGQGSGVAAGMMGYGGGGATLAPHPHPPHPPLQMATGQLSIPSSMQMPGPSSGAGGVLLPTFPPLSDARRSALHYAAVSRRWNSAVVSCAGGATFSASLTLLHLPVFASCL